MGAKGSVFLQKLPLASGLQGVLDFLKAHVLIDNGSEGVGDITPGPCYAHELFKAVGWGVPHCHSANGDDGVEFV